MKRFVYIFLFVSAFAFGQSVKNINSVEEYKLKAIDGINTQKAEFGAVPYLKGLVFVSEQKTDLVNFENTDPKGNPYLDLFYTENKNDIYGKKKSFSKKHNTEFHDGPISFNHDYTIAYLTRAIYSKGKNKKFTNQSKLFLMNKKGAGWSNPVLFKYNSDDYSLGHGSVSADGRRLFFASDMPGGFGGTDIYVCDWDGNDWGNPKNLGAQINTGGNELYPFISAAGVLFFSSGKPGGFGGLDIYSAAFSSGNWLTVRNEGININSPADDFAICFVDSTSGYFSSNRDGNDNIYSFTFEKKHIDFDGFVLNSKDPMDPSQNIKVELTDSLGNKLSETRTDEKGYFKFHSLKSDEIYLVRIDETDPAFNGKKHYYLADKNNNILRVTNKNGNNNFVFKNLPRDGNTLAELDIDDALTIAGNLLSSQNPAIPIANKKIVLKDAKGNVIDEATTNSFGAFVFSKIPPDEAFYIEFDENDVGFLPGTIITLTNKSGKTIKTIVTGHTGDFKIHFLEKDKNELADMSVKDSDLLLDFRSVFYDENNVPISNLVVFLKDDKLKLVEKSTTDAEGKISFRKLLTDKNYLLEFDESDPRLGIIKKIIIKSQKGKVVKEIVKNNGHFNYHILKADMKELSELYVDDPWLSVLEFKNSSDKKEIIIEENVYYAYGDYNFDDAGKKVLEKVVKIMKDNPDISIELGSHTDSRANDQFNLKLSDKRAKTAVAFMIKQGVAKSRIKAIGYGETKLKNKCTNDTVCSEEEHAQNRRTEFRVIPKK